jgi:hypothetical protein
MLRYYRRSTIGSLRTRRLLQRLRRAYAAFWPVAAQDLRWVLPTDWASPPFPYDVGSGGIRHLPLLGGLHDECT